MDSYSTIGQKNKLFHKQQKDLAGIIMEKTGCVKHVKLDKQTTPCGRSTGNH